MKIRVHPAFAAYVLSIGVLASWQMCSCAVAALLLHETGHYLVARLLGERIDKVELMPFGGVMTYASAKSPSKGVKGVCVAAAGPLSNYLALLLLAVAPVQEFLGQDMARLAAASNFSMLCLNLLPVLPLDGGSIVFSIGYYFFPAAKLIAILSLFGILSGAAMILLALYGLAKLGTLNCSLLIIGCYLMICAKRGKGTMLAENLFAVVQERQEENCKIRQICLYRVPKDMRIHDLLGPMERAGSAVFMFDDEDHTRIMDEKDVCSLLLQNPSLTIAQAYAQQAAAQQQKSGRFTN